MSWSVWKKFKESVAAVQDHRLIALASSGDLIAQEVKYHTNCMTLLHRKAAARSLRDCMWHVKPVLEA